MIFSLQDWSNNVSTLAQLCQSFAHVNATLLDPSLKPHDYPKKTAAISKSSMFMSTLDTKSGQIFILPHTQLHDI